MRGIFGKMGKKYGEGIPHTPNPSWGCMPLSFPFLPPEERKKERTKERKKRRKKVIKKEEKKEKKKEREREKKKEVFPFLFPFFFHKKNKNILSFFFKFKKRLI